MSVFFDAGRGDSIEPSVTNESNQTETGKKEKKKKKRKKRKEGTQSRGELRLPAVGARICHLPSGLVKSGSRTAIL